MTKWDTPIEQTRCGKCFYLINNTCPNGNRKGDLVTKDFANKCAKLKPLES